MTVRGIYLISVLVFIFFEPCQSMSKEEKLNLKEQSLEMFHHAFKHYMDHAYPADELMPLSCRGRYRGVEPSRGDIDDVLGNYSLTLIDTLDTLVLLGELDLFEDSVKKVVRDVNFDSDIVVSVFEANIRVVGGLLGGHLMADHLKKKLNRMQWYEDDLLHLATDIGNRILPAFNTSTGMPYPRVNLRHGVNSETSRTGQERDTCTACAGTMLLEFSALSRLTGNMVYEEKASKAMDYLWKSRHSVSDLVGTVINIQSGDWVRKESGVGAGIDSYYEYLLKAYIMLGDDVYLDRFNTHYKAVMKYINNGPLMLDVHMHRPQTPARNFMDSLLAFWPGLQVLKGDLKPAIEIHEMLYQVMLRHNFIPEAFTSDFRVHWAQHPLRPEFLESTYFLFKATGDHHYLDVGKKVLENLNRIARVPCGFAAIKDVTTGDHEDQMDSFVFAETFKYLFLLFSEKEDLSVDLDDFIFTTEAHLLPLFLSVHGQNKTEEIPSHILNSLKKELEEEGNERSNDDEDEEEDFHNTCPSASHLFKGTINYAQDLRNPLKDMVERLCPRPLQRIGGRLKAVDFIAGNREQMEHLNQMGIRLITMNDGRVQLVHISSDALSPESSQDGMLFMQEMIELSKAQSKEVPLEPRVVQFLSAPLFGAVVLKAGPAQFGLNLKNHPGVEGRVVKAEPFDGCSPLRNGEEVKSRVALVERGGCMFVDKARNVQEAGGLASIVCDNNSESSSSTSQYFSMSGDGKTDVKIPSVFLFSEEARILKDAAESQPELVVYVAESPKKPEEVAKRHADVKKEVERLAEVVDLVEVRRRRRSDGKKEEEEDVDRSTLRGLQFVLSYLRLDSLAPLLRPKRSDLAGEEGAFGANQVKVIRQMVERNDRRTEGGLDSKTAGGGGERRLRGDVQREVRILFEELMIMLQRCTNLGKLLLALEFEQRKVMDSLARLVEHGYTSGAMNFGVETEDLLERLKGRLRVEPGAGGECVTSGRDEPPPVEGPSGSKGDGREEDESDEEVVASVAKDLDFDPVRLNGILDAFVERQVNELFKELLVPGEDPDSPSESGVEEEEEEGGRRISEGGRRTYVATDPTRGRSESSAAIVCSNDGCFEVTVDERDPVVEIKPAGGAGGGSDGCAFEPAVAAKEEEEPRGDVVSQLERESRTTDGERGNEDDEEEDDAVPSKSSSQVEMKKKKMSADDDDSNTNTKGSDAT